MRVALLLPWCGNEQFAGRQFQGKADRLCRATGFEAQRSGVDTLGQWPLLYGH